VEVARQGRRRRRASPNAAALAAYGRARGLSPAQIAAWRLAGAQANDRVQENAVGQARRSRADRKRVRALEREPARKRPWRRRRRC
jgi:hypothetical protein